MALSGLERALIGALQDGLPLTPRPYAALAERIGLDEAQVIALIQGLVARGVVSRFGVVVRHHELGFRANAMVVFDVPDRDVDEAGARLSAMECVTLCYRRTRRPPRWPYNLYCMIHGRDREAVLGCIADAVRASGLSGVARAVLFSRQRFKQCGARYVATAAGEPPRRAVGE